MIKGLDTFDLVTRFRIINAVLVLYGLNLLIPVIADLRGELLSSSMISFIMIASTLSIKLNDIIVKYPISFVFKLGNIFHLLLTISTFVYFVHPLTYVYTNAFLGIFEVVIFTSYSIQLDEYLAKTNPGIMARFKVYTNSKKADAILLGLATTGLLTYFFGTPSIVTFFIVYNFMFSCWLIYNWNFFDKNLIRL